jgi:hypothetical protein
MDEVLAHINYAFIGIFTAEAIAKLIALRRNYFKDNWNKFDFVVVVLTFLALIIKQFNQGIDLS